MEDRHKAVEFAADVAKQFITLSTAILALTITFATNIAKSSGAPTLLLGLSWVLYVIAIICGMWTMMALTGELEPAQDSPDAPTQTHPSIRGANVVLPALLQIAFFLIATALVVVYAWGVVVK